jgi:hypothetical protein
MFLYGIGIQYGRQFFAGLRGPGLKWNVLAAAGVIGSLAVALALGALAVVAATVLGSAAGALDAIVHPPALIRAALVGGSAGLAVILLSRGLTRLAAGAGDVPGLVRGVRLLFLALAAGIAGVGWVVGDPLPLVVALVIAGIDVVETSFLLIVVGGAGLHRQD